jgi:hypothetical protein
VSDIKLGKVRLELWEDQVPKKVLSDKYFDRLQQAHISKLAIMVDQSDYDPTLFWTLSQLSAALELANERGIKIGLTTWAYPDKKQIDQLTKNVRQTFQNARFDSWENDLEMQWGGKFTHCTFKPLIENGKVKRTGLDLAGDYLVQKMYEVCTPFVADTEITTFGQHIECGRNADVTPWVNRVLIQAYSTRKRPEGTTIDWGHSYGPGNMQKFCFDRALLTPNVGKKVKLGAGLAIYGQEWPGHTPEEAMAAAFNTSLQYPIDCIRLWSAKWLTKNPYAFNFLSSLR